MAGGEAGGIQTNLISDRFATLNLNPDYSDTLENAQTNPKSAHLITDTCQLSSTAGFSVELSIDPQYHAAADPMGVAA
ncbi:hypothetical protein ACNI3Q_06630 [Sphingomonas sp. FW199]|uniref:hypothetical protein n=1 Tax=Sphingomonas sp. FW199 TaxID=3400217 RepID=UPI003CF5FABA